MVHLRATQAVLQRLKVEPIETEPAANALGDWFVHRFVWQRQPLLMAMSQTSRLTILDVARNIQGLPQRFSAMVGERLHLLGVPNAEIDLELSAMGKIAVARTNDRSTLSAINQFVILAKACLDDSDGNLSSAQLESGGILTRFAGTKQYLKPSEEAHRLLSR